MTSPRQPATRRKSTQSSDEVNALLLEGMNKLLGTSEQSGELSTLKEAVFLQYNSLAQAVKKLDDDTGKVLGTMATTMSTISTELRTLANKQELSAQNFTSQITSLRDAFNANREQMEGKIGNIEGKNGSFDQRLAELERFVTVYKTEKISERVTSVESVTNVFKYGKIILISIPIVTGAIYALKQYFTK